MKLKILICVVLIVSIFCSVCGCTESFSEYIESLDTYKKDGVTYERHYNNDGEYFYYVAHISSTGDNSPLYIPDEIDGISVTGIGHSALMMNYSATISGVEKVYFPWSISYSPQRNIEYTSEVKYIVSASTTTLIDEHYYPTFVIPYSSFVEYEKMVDNKENIIPANVSYLFNYADSPNEGYFFIDLLEESGKLNKLPYDPKREEYIFDGWYKETECINKWNFDTDIVTIEYDENGERIYEEICLYAKWIKIRGQSQF